MVLSPEIITTSLVDRQPFPGSIPSPRVDECRRLVAKKYLEIGFVTPEDIENGLLSEEIDPDVTNSEYFWTTNDYGDIVATLRIIHPAGDKELPIQKAFTLDEEYQQVLDYTLENEPESLVEISALAKSANFSRHALLDMYKAVWQHSKRSGIKVGAMSADVKQFEILSGLLGRSVQPCGQTKFMMGSDTVPAFLFPDECAEAVTELYEQKLLAGKSRHAGIHRAMVEYLIDGLDWSCLSEREIAAFERMELMPPCPALTVSI